MKEKEIENAILHALALDKRIFCWKNQTVGVFDPRKGIFRKSNNPFHIKGVADILGITNDGRLIAIEVKTHKTRSSVSPEQKAFIKKITEYGGIGGVAVSVEEALEIINKALTNQSDLDKDTNKEN